MGYLIITAKHHDGFAMYDSTVSDFNVVKATPWKQDPMRALKQACASARAALRLLLLARPRLDRRARRGLGQEPQGRAADAAAWARRYVDRKVIPQVQELIAKYDPDIFWFDTPEKLSVEENLRILRGGARGQAHPGGQRPRGAGDARACRRRASATTVSTTDKPAEFPPARRVRLGGHPHHQRIVRLAPERRFPQAAGALRRACWPRRPPAGATCC